MPPGLAVIIVGERKDSQTYVRNKEKTCSECGIESTKIELPYVCPRTQSNPREPTWNGP